MKTLYVTDLDGTFLTKEERISSYSLEKVNALVDRGMLFTYATARSEWSAEKATQGLKLNIPAVLYNGALIYDRKTDTPLYASYFDDEGALRGFFRQPHFERGERGLVLAERFAHAPLVFQVL